MTTRWDELRKALETCADPLVRNEAVAATLTLEDAAGEAWRVAAEQTRLERGRAQQAEARVAELEALLDRYLTHSSRATAQADQAQAALHEIVDGANRERHRMHGECWAVKVAQRYVSEEGS